MSALQELIQVELNAKEFGFDWSNLEMIIDQAIDECREIREAIDLEEPADRLQEEIGDLLHTAISMCVYAEFDIEQTLDNTYRKFQTRMNAVRHFAHEKGYKTLRDQPIELLLQLWQEAKKYEKSLSAKDVITIRMMSSTDVSLIVDSFAKVNWNKPIQIFENYLIEQEKQTRIVKLAFFNEQYAGYATLKWQSDYQYFAENNIPEIKDLNVLPEFRRNGIGSKLIDDLENEARAKNYSSIGLGVGLYADYGNAQNLYIKKNYKPDKRGISYNDKSVEYGESIMLDDNLTLMFVKKLSVILNKV